MATSIYFPPRANGHAEKTHHANGLPVYTSSSAVQEKWHRHQHTSSWFVPITLPIPGVRTRRLRLLAPNPTRLHQFSVTRFGRRRGSLILCVCLVAAVYTVFALHKRFATEEKTWPTPPIFSDPTTLVFRREDVQKVWEWEIAAGHYPSTHKIPEQIGLTAPPHNPAIPARHAATLPPRFRSPTVTNTIGTGSKRVYLNLHSTPPDVSYPPRPVSGSVADLDVIMNQCDFSTDKYVRDCLEMLRIGGGLDNGKRVRRGKMDEWRYMYVETGEGENSTVADMVKPMFALKTQGELDASNGFTKKRGAEWEPHLHLSPPPKYTSPINLPSPCDEDNPRLFHMFWTGPFTDKPYMALMSFLYTQNIALHLDNPSPDVCRPKFYLWISPGPAALPPAPTAMKDMFDMLKSSPWASPFLHPRFKDVIQFKLWNTTEQLDGVPEVKDEWRVLRERLFNSGGFVEKVPEQAPLKAETTTIVEDEEDATVAAAAAPTGDKLNIDQEDKVNRVGSKSPGSYDRMSVILSDLSRFVLCHRFGGIYLDADTIFLRDWEELWGWRGAFAYRWSRLETYNTAVLRLNKRSALGTFLFRTALKNGLDFHPMTIHKYVKDAHLDQLLLRLPDALFDSAWLNTESYQRDRPPQPYFTEFADFFDTPLVSSGSPQALGFDGFFKGAYSYHFHNFWWKPFDPSRNFPDLGPRFRNGEMQARYGTSSAAASASVGPLPEDQVADDKRDLDWSTVLKRTFEAYIRGERPNMYGEWLKW